MAFIPVPDTAEVIIVFTYGAREARVVLNIRSAIAWTLANLENLATIFVDTIISDGIAWIGHQWTAEKIHITDLSSSSGASFDWITGTSSNLPIAGGSPDFTVSAQEALVTTLRTANRGRSYRGRNYWPGLVDTQMTAGATQIATTRVAAQQTFVSNLKAAINSVYPNGLVVVSRHTGGSPRVTGVTTPVTSLDTNNLVDTQRRRVRP
jgi:hypothetical protein